MGSINKSVILGQIGQNISISKATFVQSIFTGVLLSPLVGGPRSLKLNAERSQVPKTPSGASSFELLWCKVG